MTTYVPEKPPLDTTSNFRKPTSGKAGVYVYQWKSGILGAGYDAVFEIKGHPEIRLNTGEYGHIELDPGPYEYKLEGGLLTEYLPITFEADKNFFFRCSISFLSYSCYPILTPMEMESAKKNILSGRYEWYDID